jgi:hypothetical protein
MSTRREFIRQIGIALASAVMAGCTGSGGAGQPAPTSTLAPVPTPTSAPTSTPTLAPTLTATPAPTSTPAPTPTPTPALTPTPECVPFEAEGNSGRERLRNSWMSLDWLAQQATVGLECGDQARVQLMGAHQAALQDLVEDGELQADVREYVQSAFDEAVYHVWRSHIPVSCYEVAGPLYHPERGATSFRRRATWPKSPGVEMSTPRPSPRPKPPLSATLLFSVCQSPSLRHCTMGWRQPAGIIRPLTRSSSRSRPKRSKRHLF